MKVIVGTPTYNHQVMAQFTSSLLALAGLLHARGAQFEWLSVQSTLINIARNYMATTVLDDPSVTHLLFIDSDVSFSPQAVARMIDFDRPVTSTLYPRRALDAAKVVDAARRGAAAAEAFAAGLGYPFIAATPAERRNGFVSADVAPAGLMLIKREVFERLRDSDPELYREATGSLYMPYGLKRVLMCFEPSLNPHGVPIGEDVAFCRRWRAIGGEIWALVDEVTGHTGPYTFAGKHG